MPDITPEKLVEKMDRVWDENEGATSKIILEALLRVVLKAIKYGDVIIQCQCPYCTGNAIHLKPSFQKFMEEK